MKRRITAWAQNKWKDPVWSKVIANAIWYGPMVFVGGLLLKVWESIDVNSFVIVKGFIIRYLLYNLSIPVWYIIVGIPLISCTVWLYRRIRKAIGKQVLEKQNEIWSEQLGDYTFGQLYRILEETRLLTKTPKMRNSQIGPPNASLLELFGYLIPQHLFALRGGQFAPNSGGQFTPNSGGQFHAEQVVSLNRIEVVSITEFSTKPHHTSYFGNSVT